MTFGAIAWPLLTFVAQNSVVLKNALWGWFLPLLVWFQPCRYKLNHDISSTWLKLLEHCEVDLKTRLRSQVENCWRSTTCFVREKTCWYASAYRNYGTNCLRSQLVSTILRGLFAFMPLGGKWLSRFGNVRSPTGTPQKYFPYHQGGNPIDFSDRGLGFGCNRGLEGACPQFISVKRGDCCWSCTTAEDCTH